MIMLAVYNCFQIPIEVSFDTEVFKRTEMKLLSGFIDLMFFIDILLAFRTTFLDERSGQEVTDLNLIAEYYLHK